MVSCRNDSGGGTLGVQVGRLVILAGLALAALPGVGHAQPRQNVIAFSPSMEGPTGRNGQLSSTYGTSASYMRTRSAADVAMAGSGGSSSFSGGGRSRRGAGGFDLSSFASGTRLLSRSSSQGLYASYSRHARPGELLDMVRSLASNGEMPARGMNQEAMDRTRNRLSSWGSPEMVARRSETILAQTQPAGAPGVSAAAPKVTLQQLVKNSLAGRRSVYEGRALDAFKAGKYNEACDQLVLADATAIEDPDQRVYVKLLFFYMSLAARQYQEALGTLEWVLARDYKDGGRAVPAALKQLRNMESLYGDPKEYQAQLAVMDKFTTLRTDTTPTPEEKSVVSVLRAMVKWGDNDSANAKFFAEDAVKLSQQIGQGGENHHWSRLADYMSTAEQGGDTPQFVGWAPVETGKRPVATTRPGLLTLEAVPVPAAR